MKAKSFISFLLAIVLAFGVFGAFVSAEDESEVRTVYRGDVNIDGKIDASDARLALRISAKLADADDFTRALADADKDGDVTAKDARLILRYSARLISSFSEAGEDNETVQTPAETTTAAPAETTTAEIPPVETTTAAPVETTAAEPVKRDPENCRIAMLGDSLVEDLFNYDNTYRIDFYGKVNLTCDRFFTWSVSGSSRYVIDEVNGRDYDVIIVLIGMNQVDYDNTYYKNSYRQVIEGLQSRAPEADIILHLITPISAAASARNEFGCNNGAINRKNDVIKSLAEEYDLEYIDAREVLADDSGCLISGAASDGVHPGPTYARIWINWILDTIFE